MGIEAVNQSQMQTNEESHQDRIFKLLFEQDEITWQSILYEAVKSEEMDPWDIDIGLLAQRFVEMLEQLKEMNFRISGKIILAAAILLKLKSERLVGRDLVELDRLINQVEENEEEVLFDEGYVDYSHAEKLTEEEKIALIPRIPQPRKRKVSIYDLVRALEKALEVKRRRVLRELPEYSIVFPDNKKNISVVIKELYIKIKKYFYSSNRGHITFSELAPSKEKKDRAHTFVPLLHLSNQRKIDLHQDEHFGEINIHLKSKKEEQILSQKTEINPFA